jgi:hypothetical protein
MADDAKLPAPGIGGNGFIWIVLVAAGTYFVAHRVPLEGSRPPAIKQSLYERTGAQDIDARLWQDPFATVADTLTKSPDLTKVCKGPKDNSYRIHCLSPLDDQAAVASSLPSVLVVSVSGAPYSEDHEFRLRIRYAVLAGLNAEGFVPDDSRHIGFYWPREAASSRDSSSSAQASLETSPALLVASASEAPPATLPRVVPFEWFTRKSKGEVSKFLLLWFDEDVLREAPLKQYAELLCPSVGASPRWGKVKILGPSSSTALEAMVHEVAVDETDKAKAGAKTLDGMCPGKTRPQFYSYSATVNDASLVLAAGTVCKSDACLADIFKSRIDFYRMIATDQALARTIRDELRLRRVNVDNVDQKRNSHVALVSEWDTLYGRALPNSIARCLGELADCQGDDIDPFPGKPWLHRFKYLRGLDGQLPNADGTSSSRSGTTDTAGKADKSAKDGAKNPADSRASDRAEGQGQFDYLRRLGDQMQQLDADLRRSTTNGIAAVGVLGSDLYDKQLVLQALRPLLPNALFFTTDMDALLLHASALPFTRNLLVASSFGLQLKSDIQKEIPPFRSSYQTAAFLATRVAIGSDASPPQWSMTPLLFEVGASREFQFAGRSLGPDRSEKSAALQQDQSDCGKDLLKCSDIQPFAPAMAADVSLSMAIGISSLGLLLVLGLRSPRRRAWEAVDAFMGRSSNYALMAGRLAALLLGLGAVVLAVAMAIHLLWRPLATWLTYDGQPLTLFEGISVWPTVFLRILALILCIWFIVRSLRKLDSNIDKIAGDMCLTNTRERVKKAQKELVSKSSLWTRFVSEFWYRLPGDDDPTDGDGERLPQPVFDFWRTYLYQGRVAARIFRVLVALLVMAGLWWILGSVFGYPTPPTRGSVSYYAYVTVTVSLVFATLFLVFSVADATLLSWRIVKAFRAETTIWPPEAMEKYSGRLGLSRPLPDEEVLDDWLDLVFISKRTKCITNLIYFPFLILALLILSQSRLFANFVPSVPDLMATGLAALTVCACAVALRWSAEDSRAKARRRLNDQIVAARKLKDGRLAGQLEMLLRRVEELQDGAFSPLSQQPLVRAILLPLASFGGTALLEYLLLPGLS